MSPALSFFVDRSPERTLLLLSRWLLNKRSLKVSMCGTMAQAVGAAAATGRALTHCESGSVSVLQPPRMISTRCWQESAHTHICSCKDDIESVAVQTEAGSEERANEAAKD